ncbi:hypothetical protein LTR95_002124 [Oleoguttula sp. CCFEE 5521]
MEPPRGMQVGSLDASGHANVNVGDTCYQTDSRTARDSYGNATNLYQLKQYFSNHPYVAGPYPQPSGPYWASPTASPPPPFAQSPPGAGPVVSFGSLSPFTAPPAQYFQAQTPGMQHSPPTADVPRSSSSARLAATPSGRGGGALQDATHAPTRSSEQEITLRGPKLLLTGADTDIVINAFVAKGLRDHTTRSIMQSLSGDERSCVAAIARGLESTTLTSALRQSKAVYPKALASLYKKLVTAEREASGSEPDPTYDGYLHEISRKLDLQKPKERQRRGGP